MAELAPAPGLSGGFEEARERDIAEGRRVRRELGQERLSRLRQTPIPGQDESEGEAYERRKREATDLGLKPGSSQYLEYVAERDLAPQNEIAEGRREHLKRFEIGRRILRHIRAYYHVSNVQRYGLNTVIGPCPEPKRRLLQPLSVCHGTPLSGATWVGPRMIRQEFYQTDSYDRWRSLAIIVKCEELIDLEELKERANSGREPHNEISLFLQDPTAYERMLSESGRDRVDRRTATEIQIDLYKKDPELYEQIFDRVGTRSERQMRLKMIEAAMRLSESVNGQVDEKVFLQKLAELSSMNIS